MTAPEPGPSVLAPFAGAAAPPAPLTWGQRALWIALRRRGPEQFTISMSRIVPVPPDAPADIASVVAAVGAVIGRHSSLRTRIEVAQSERGQGEPGQGEPGQGEPGQGEPGQVVAADGELAVRTFRAGGGRGEGAVMARDVARELAAEPFDHGREWPQRVALVLVGDRVRQVVWVFSHTTVDLWSAEIVAGDLLRLLRGEPLATPAGPQSVDVARREHGSERRQSERAVAYWVRGFGRLPLQTLPRLGPPASPRFRRWLLVSEAADLAAGLVARQSGVTGSTVLLAATAAVISIWSGTDICGIHSMSNNRSLDGYQSAIAKLNQLALVIVDLSGRPTFSALLPRVWQAALQAYRHAHYDPQDMQRGYRAAGFPYATGVSPHCYFNDSRFTVGADLAGRATGETEVREALARTAFVPAETFDHFTWRMRVQILAAPAGVTLALTGDTSYLPPAAAERFLRDIEHLVVEAAFRDLPWPWR